MNHYECIGIDCLTPEDYLARYSEDIQYLAEPIPLGEGKWYFHWSDPSGAELWLGGSEESGLCHEAPHFSGQGRLRLENFGTMDREPVNFHGAFTGVESEAPDRGYVLNLIFDDPAFVLDLPRADKAAEVAITAFPRTIRHFADAETFTRETQLSVEFFCDMGAWADSLLHSRSDFPVRVIEATERVNSLSGVPFVHCLCHLLTGTIDVVFASGALPELPQPGSVLMSNFWLSGRILDM